MVEAPHLVCSMRFSGYERLCLCVALLVLPPTAMAGMSLFVLSVFSDMRPFAAWVMASSIILSHNCRHT